MAATGIPIDRIFLVGIWIETVLYGMNCIIFAAAMYVLLIKRRGMVPRPLTAMTMLLFAFSTAHVSLVLRQLLEAFIWGEPGTASAYFSEQHAPLPNTKLVLYSLNVFAQDLILIWRLWVVFEKNWWVTGPFLVWEFMHTAAGFIAEARGSSPAISPFDKVLRDWALVNWTLDLAVNIGCTALIAIRLWWVGRRARRITKSGGNKYFGVILTMVESGTIFALATLIAVALYLSGSFATFAAVDSVIQLATMTPLLIIVRVGLNLTYGKSIHTTVHTPDISQLCQPSMHPINASDATATRVQVTINNKSCDSDPEDYALEDLNSSGSKEDDYV
ncbi:hypothetical protein BDZ89DRAFT_1129962 [Hymenopellis radicata]|nr:hypothetical protein BDZ89DRAFT_1129962 [Hymenopellis radicata]